MKAFKIDFDTVDKPLSEYFEKNDLGSTLSMKNLGSTFFFLFLYATMWILYLIMKFLCKTRF